MIRTSYTGTVVDGVVFVLCRAMFVEDELEERLILALKGRDNLMDCSIFTLLSRVHTSSYPRSVPMTSSDDDTSQPRRYKRSI